MKTLNLLALIAATLVLCSCDKTQDGTTAGQKLDKAVGSAEKAADEVKKSATEGLNEAAQVGKEKSDQVARTVSDVAITTAINADLTKDRELSALRINVDTKDGRVTLYGSAPNAAAKERAQTIAMSEKGVTAVDNKLAVETR